MGCSEGQDGWGGGQVGGSGGAGEFQPPAPSLEVEAVHPDVRRVERVWIPFRRLGGGGLAPLVPLNGGLWRRIGSKSLVLFVRGSPSGRFGSQKGGGRLPSALRRCQAATMPAVCAGPRGVGTGALAVFWAAPRKGNLRDFWSRSIALSSLGLQ
jgi:hypothetical protein